MSIFMIKMHAKLPQHNSEPFQLLGWVKKKKEKKRERVNQLMLSKQAEQ